MVVLKPRQATRHLSVSTLDGSWSLSDQAPENFTMLVFYRGLHCPICKNYLQELNRVQADFGNNGVGVLVVSNDTQERAARAVDDWELDNLTVGWGLTKAQA